MSGVALIRRHLSLTSMTLCDRYDVCPVCGVKQVERHSVELHDSWRHNLTGIKAFEQIRADREATGFPVDWDYDGR
jgi:hypothetical protein